MWIMMNDGFVSAVQDKVVPSRLVVRARKRSHLTSLFGKKYKIIRTPNADYLYRVYVEKAVFSEIMVDRIEAIDYENFKKSVPDDALHNVYSKIWSLFFNYQHDEEKGRIEWIS